MVIYGLSTNVAVSYARRGRVVPRRGTFEESIPTSGNGNQIVLLTRIELSLGSEKKVRKFLFSDLHIYKTIKHFPFPRTKSCVFDSF